MALCNGDVDSSEPASQHSSGPAERRPRVLFDDEAITKCRIALGEPSFRQWMSDPAGWLT